MRHVLQTYLPDQTETTYNLRNCTHNKSLINKTSHLNENDYYTNALQRHLLVTVCIILLMTLPATITIVSG